MHLCYCELFHARSTPGQIQYGRFMNQGLNCNTTGTFSVIWDEIHGDMIRGQVRTPHLLFLGYNLNLASLFSYFQQVYLNSVNIFLVFYATSHRNVWKNVWNRMSCRIKIVHFYLKAINVFWKTIKSFVLISWMYQLFVSWKYNHLTKVRWWPLSGVEIEVEFSLEVRDLWMNSR